MIEPRPTTDRDVVASLGLDTELRELRPDQWPHPADFAAPTSAAQRAAWAEADRAARPQRIARLRERMAAKGVDGYFGVRWEHMRYLTGLPFDESEVTGSGPSDGRTKQRRHKLMPTTAPGRVIEGSNPARRREDLPDPLIP